MSETITEHDAAAAKARNHPTPDTGLPPNQHWFFQNFASVQAALNYLNAAPAQAAGEVSANARNDGTVGIFYIFPPTVPLDRHKAWFFSNFPSPTDALNFLNDQPVQSDGEVSAIARNDGTVGMFYIAPA